MKARTHVSMSLFAVVASLTWTTVSAQPQPTPPPGTSPPTTPAPVPKPAPPPDPKAGSASADPAPEGMTAGSAAEGSAAAPASDAPDVAPSTSTEPDPDASTEPEADAETEAEFPTKQQLHRNFAGSVQLDYMSVPSQRTGRDVGLDGATVELSLKLAMDFSNRISANVKMCVACHGFEVGMAFFDMRVADQLNFRVGRFSPAFGEFPLRHDPANHRTSDKPLPYDMGRMVRQTEWNQGVLPAPWVDNGIEVNGTHFFGNNLQVDYAAYAISGPRAGGDPMDFDFKASRSGESYYVDNNSRPAYGGQLVATLIAGSASVAFGASAMRGTYDAEHKRKFAIYGAHAVVRMRDVFFRAEYLRRLTEMALTDNPTERFKYGAGMGGTWDPYFVKDGGYLELETPVNRRVTLVLREDGMRRRGNVVMTSALRSESAILRHTAGLAILLRGSLRLKLSYEYYDFSDFDDESVVHIGVAGPF